MDRIEPHSLVGSWRRFGEAGPSYEVIDIGGFTADGTDRAIRIRLAETGEEVDYTLNRAVNDEVLAASRN
jgi:hypothetical protein